MSRDAVLFVGMIGVYLLGALMGYLDGWGRRKRLCRSLARRVAEQSELLSRRAEPC